jgi:S1-C subfamily serine protease
VNGQLITGNTSLVAIIRDSAPGDRITITVERDGKKQDLIATLVARTKD